MTIALLIKVHDGVVLAADSASTLTAANPDGSMSIMNIYNNANKVFNLHKGLPIGAMTWGLGNIGPASISTLSKDLRAKFQEQSSGPWAIDRASYDIEAVAAQAAEFFYNDHFVPLYGNDGGNTGPDLGYLVGGYSSGADQPRVFVISSTGPNAGKPTEILAGDTGAAWWGQPEAIQRILTGTSLDTAVALTNLGVPLPQAHQTASAIQQQVQTQLVVDAMPIQDAIDLAEFLVHATIQYVRFSPGGATVGGPIEIATITKHEGFKWVARKHYFQARLNPASEII
ncbi:hypothetical protein [Leifsonia virtsii]|uniref:Uncharacterized protein n=1 Tax=Leifsonia virtsii TaxID=3035915 RepID=A0ABT8IV70_9MICO|nr:hypothetical protein [Leifsonia virtsii]MDN4596712.1 hypothetical protein [Leifsonia virtsii]